MSRPLLWALLVLASPPLLAGGPHETRVGPAGSPELSGPAARPAAPELGMPGSAVLGAAAAPSGADATPASGEAAAAPGAQAAHADQGAAHAAEAPLGVFGPAPQKLAGRKLQMLEHRGALVRFMLAAEGANGELGAEAFDGLRANPWKDVDFGGRKPVMLLVGGGHNPVFLRKWIMERFGQTVDSISKEGLIPGLEMVVVDNPEFRPPGLYDDRFIPLDILSLAGEPSADQLAKANAAIDSFLAARGLVGVGSKAVINTWVLLNASVANHLRETLPQVQANPVGAISASIDKGQTRQIMWKLAPARTMWSRPINGSSDDRATVLAQAEKQFSKFESDRPGRTGMLKAATGAGKAGVGGNIRSAAELVAAIKEVYRQMDGFWAGNKQVSQMHTLADNPVFLLEEMIRRVWECDVEIVVRRLSGGALELIVHIIGNPKPVPSTFAEKGLDLPAPYKSGHMWAVAEGAIQSLLAVWAPYHEAPKGNQHIEMLGEEQDSGYLVEINPDRPGGASVVPDTEGWTSRTKGADGAPREQAAHVLLDQGIRADLGLPLSLPKGAGAPHGVLVRRKILPTVNGTFVAATIDGKPITPNVPVTIAPDVTLTIGKKAGDKVYAAGSEYGAKVEYSDDMLGSLVVRRDTHKEAVPLAHDVLGRVKITLLDQSGKPVEQSAAAFHSIDD